MAPSMRKIAITILLITLSMATHHAAQWISSNLSLPLLHPDEYGFAVGYYNNTITLLGGRSWSSTQTSRRIIEYEISSNRYTVLDDTLPENVYANDHYYTQIQNILYFYDVSDTKIQFYDLSTKQFTSSYPSDPLPSTYDQYSCLTSSNDTLFLMGGGIGNTISILSLSSSTWHNGPNMKEYRTDFLSCAMSESSGNIYAISGYDHGVRLKTVEYISIVNIYSNTWSYTQNNFYTDLSGHSSVAHEDYIYIVGGWTNDAPTNDFHIIDTKTNIITRSVERLPIGVSIPVVIVVHNILYAFGGISDGVIKGYSGTSHSQYIDLLRYNGITTSFPTVNPTTTANPTTFMPTITIPMHTTDFTNTISSHDISTSLSLLSPTTTMHTTANTTTIGATAQTSIQNTDFENTNSTQWIIRDLEAIITYITNADQVTENTTEPKTEENINANIWISIIVAMIAFICLLSVIIMIRCCYRKHYNINITQKMKDNNDGKSMSKCTQCGAVSQCVMEEEFICNLCKELDRDKVTNANRIIVTKGDSNNTTGATRDAMAQDKIANRIIITKRDSNSSSSWAASNEKSENYNMEGIVDVAMVGVRSSEGGAPKCSECGLIRDGKVDDNDGEFYCFICWSQYQSTTRGDNATEPI